MSRVLHVTERAIAPRTAGTDTDAAGEEERVLRPGGRRRHASRDLLLAAGGYLAVSVLVWWNIWSAHPASTTTCGCGDSSLFLWFLAWPAHAISHGLDPFYSTAMSYPGGVNLLANTSELAIGVLLAPVTWLFGPVASLDVAVTLAPALSALAAFVLVRRWVSWAPAAFAGGLFYGFSPLIIVSLTDAHLMVGMAPVPPLVALCLDELWFRQRRRPVAVGVGLGLLLVLQFFLGTEVLVIVVMAATIAGLMVLGWGIAHRDELRARWHHALIGTATALGTAVALLAWPAWFALAGPAHTSGPVWPMLYLGYEGTDLRDYVLPAPASASFEAFTHRVGGFQGETLSVQYVGIGMLAVLIVGLLVWRRDRRLWLWGGIGAATWVLALGARVHRWLPWQLFSGLPILQNIIPSRFLLVITLAAAAMLALIVDHTHCAVSRYTAARADSAARPGHRAARHADRGVSRWAGAVAGLGVAAVAIVPVAAYLAPTVPLSTQPVVLPTWFRTVAPHLRGHQVLLVFPVPNQVIESAMTWQAVDGMAYTMALGGGPGGTQSRAGSLRPGDTVIGNASFSFTRQVLHPGDVAAARSALDGWGVTMVVIPDQPGLAPYDRVSWVPFAVGLVTAATGRPPVRQAGAWVWTGVRSAGSPADLTSQEFVRCTALGRQGDPMAIAAMASCVTQGAGANTSGG